MASMMRKGRMLRKSTKECLPDRMIRKRHLPNKATLNSGLPSYVTVHMHLCCLERVVRHTPRIEALPHSSSGCRGCGLASMEPPPAAAAEDRPDDSEEVPVDVLATVNSAALARWSTLVEGVMFQLPGLRLKQVTLMMRWHVLFDGMFRGPPWHIFMKESKVLLAKVNEEVENGVAAVNVAELGKQRLQEFMQVLHEAQLNAGPANFAQKVRASARVLPPPREGQQCS